jgi:hypothetical protein
MSVRTSVSKRRFSYPSCGQARVNVTASRLTPSAAVVTIHRRRRDRGASERHFSLSEGAIVCLQYLERERYMNGALENLFVPVSHLAFILAC